MRAPRDGEADAKAVSNVRIVISGANSTQPTYPPIAIIPVPVWWNQTTTTTTTRGVGNNLPTSPTSTTTTRRPGVGSGNGGGNGGGNRDTRNGGNGNDGVGNGNSGDDDVGTSVSSINSPTLVFQPQLVMARQNAVERTGWPQPIVPQPVMMQPPPSYFSAPQPAYFPPPQPYYVQQYAAPQQWITLASLGNTLQAVRRFPAQIF